MRRGLWVLGTLCVYACSAGGLAHAWLFWRLEEKGVVARGQVPSYKNGTHGSVFGHFKCKVCKLAVQCKVHAPPLILFLRLRTSYMLHNRTVAKKKWSASLKAVPLHSVHELPLLLVLSCTLLMCG